MENYYKTCFQMCLLKQQDADLEPLTPNLSDSSSLTCFSANYHLRFCSIEASERRRMEQLLFLT